MADETVQTQRKPRLWIIWLLVIAFLAFLAIGYRNTVRGRPQVGETAPNLNLTYYEGYEFNGQPIGTLEDMRGQVVLLNFWASWCVPCRQEAAILEAVSRDYRERDVIFLGVAWSDTETKAFEYLQEFNITYPNAPDLGLDAQDIYKFDSVPETYIIDRDGTILDFHIGPLTDPQLRGKLDTVLATQ